VIGACGTVRAAVIGAATAIAVTTRVSPCALALPAAVLTATLSAAVLTAPLSVLPAVAAFAAALHVSATATALHAAAAAAVHSSTARGSRTAHTSCLCEFWRDCHERDCHRERNCLFHRCIPYTVLPSDLEMTFERWGRLVTWTPEH
jgi:hypothetical protein